MKAPVAHDGYARVARRLLPALLLGAATVLALGVGGGVFAFSQLDACADDRARMDLGNVQRALETFRQRTGALPPEAGWVEALVAAGILERTPLDPWDRPYEYRREALGDGGVRARVSSLGRDGAPNTADDIAR
jgi:hypothetical protein